MFSNPIFDRETDQLLELANTRKEEKKIDVVMYLILVGISKMMLLSVGKANGLFSM